MEKFAMLAFLFGLYFSALAYRINTETTLNREDDLAKQVGVSRLKQLIHILESIEAMNELQNTVRVTSRQTRTDIVEKSIGGGYKRGYGDSAVLPPWNEFCRLVGMRNCFTSSRSYQ